MRKAVALMVALAMVAGGCSGETGTAKVVQPTARPPKPKVGDKVILPMGLLDLWNDLDAMRRSLADPPPHEPSHYQTPEYKAMDSHRFGLVVGGDLVEVLEVDDDYAAVDVVRTRFGDPGDKHGYVAKWW